MSEEKQTLGSIARSIEEIGIDGAAWDARYRCFKLCAANLRTLPVYGRRERDLAYDDEAAARLLSFSRCLREKRPVKDGELPVAWMRVQNGFAPLFDRGAIEGASNPDN